MRTSIINRLRPLVTIAAVAIALGAASAWAQSECLIGVQGQGSTTELTGIIQCTDGDPSCDGDGVQDNKCTFMVRGCLNEANVAGCTQQPLKKAKFKTTGVHNLIQLSPVSGSTAEACTQFVGFEVPLKKKGKKPGKRKIIANAKSDTKPRMKDVDKIKFQCNPCTDPATCSGGGGTTTTTLPVACPKNAAGGPDQLTLTVAATGNDLDTGYSGQSHNFINVAGSQLKYCLSNCDGSTDSVCDASGGTGNNALNGPTFGPPLPLFSANVAVCVVNRFQDPSINATVDVATGAFDASTTPVVLLSDTYQGSATQVCPRCVGGKCDSGRNQGQSCQVDGSVVVNNPPNINNVKYDVSKTCLPKNADLLGTPKVSLGLTTETSTLAGNAAGNFPCPGQTAHNGCGGGTCTVDCSAKADPKGGINQTCCSSTGQRPCFPTADGGSLSRTGTPVIATPVWPDPTYPKVAQGGTLAATFCIPSTGGVTVDATAGLPGPGALLLSGETRFDKAQ
jgi:hypothetical protein